MRSPFQLSLFDTIAKWFQPPRRSRLPALARRSDEQLRVLWRSIRLQYFPDSSEVDDYVVTWSRRRQRRVLASCHIERREVHVAHELSDEAQQRWLSPILYHEMCHAIIGKQVAKRRGKRLWHGPEFKRLVARHPLTAELEHWIRSGGWLSAVRSSRARASAAKRKRIAA